jgi:hypothetical protein
MAEEMNYQPLSHAQAIKTGQTRSLGLVLQLSDHDAQRPFLAEFLAGLSAGASQKGYTLTVASADNDAHLIEVFQSLIRVISLRWTRTRRLGSATKARGLPKLKSHTRRAQTAAG